MLALRGNCGLGFLCPQGETQASNQCSPPLLILQAEVLFADNHVITPPLVFN